MRTDSKLIVNRGEFIDKRVVARHFQVYNRFVEAHASPLLSCGPKRVHNLETLELDETAVDFPKLGTVTRIDIVPPPRSHSLTFKRILVAICVIRL